MLVARRPGKQQDISYSFSAQLSCISSIWYIYLPCLESKSFLFRSDYQSEALLLQIITCLDHSLYYLLPKGAKKEEILTERERELIKSTPRIHRSKHRNHDRRSKLVSKNPSYLHKLFYVVLFIQCVIYDTHTHEPSIICSKFRLMHLHPCD